MNGPLQSGGKGGAPLASQQEVEFAATNGPEANEKKAVTPKGLHWWWEKLRTLPLNFTDVVTFTKAIIITAFTGAGERLIVCDANGKIIAAYLTADEFIAVPAGFNSPGIPGQKAYGAPFLWYCIAANTWVNFLAAGSEFGFMETYVAVPATLTSPGKKGERAYDPTAGRMYECIIPNVWIYWQINQA